MELIISGFHLLVSGLPQPKILLQFARWGTTKLVKPPYLELYVYVRLGGAQLKTDHVIFSHFDCIPGTKHRAIITFHS